MVYLPQHRVSVSMLTTWVGGWHNGTKQQAVGDEKFSVRSLAQQHHQSGEAVDAGPAIENKQTVGNTLQSLGSTGQCKIVSHSANQQGFSITAEVMARALRAGEALSRTWMLSTNGQKKTVTVLANHIWFELDGDTSPLAIVWIQTHSQTCRILLLDSWSKQLSVLPPRFPFLTLSSE